MKKLLFILPTIIAINAYSQIDWPNYSTSFEETVKEVPALGVAIPYNGIYDNFEKKNVGFSNWNPQFKLNIDTVLSDEIPLFFVYDTSGFYFLVPHLNKKNADDFEFTVLLNNKINITPWSRISQFTQIAIGSMEAGSGISRRYRVGVGQYLVAHLRNNQGKIISSSVVYFKSGAPEIKYLNTSDNALAFSKLLNSKTTFGEALPDIGWHRQYTSNLSGDSSELKLSYNENNVLIYINAEIYKKDALEYAIFKNGKEIRKWNINEYDKNYILLKNLDPGNYNIRIRFRRQRDSVTELHFLVSPVWYKTAAFKAAVLTFLLLTIIFLIFLSKYRKQKKIFSIINKKAEQSVEELKNIQALLNPHFIFNALSSIQGLVIKGKAVAASKYLSSFADLLRETLKESRTDLISVTKELKNLETYISLEQLRYPFSYNFNVDKNLDLHALTIPPFLLQPFVENAIKHGFSKMNGSGRLNVNIIKSKDAMEIKIIDNGPGLKTAYIKEGYGLSLSRKRIELLNYNYKEELIKLYIEDVAVGSSILLSFKNWL